MLYYIFFGVDLQCWQLDIGNKQWKQAMLRSLGLGWISTFYHTAAKPAGEKSQGKFTSSKVDAEWQIAHTNRETRTQQTRDLERTSYYVLHSPYNILVPQRSILIQRKMYDIFHCYPKSTRDNGWQKMTATA